jgi:uncharacterized protein (DUF433 family)
VPAGASRAHEVARLGRALPEGPEERSSGMKLTFEGFDRITADPMVLEGKPCVRGMRLTVQRILQVLASNPSWTDLRKDYPELEEEDVRQVLGFAAASLGDHVVPVKTPAE